MVPKRFEPLFMGPYLLSQTKQSILLLCMVVELKDDAYLDLIVRILRECGAKKVFLFGSTAKGRERSGSDLDLACEGLPSERFFEALGKLLLFAGRNIDLIDLDEVKEPLRRRIEREGILLYEAT